jgi:2-oxoglutarate ferredoxin oxidoreductase subunit alpha
MARICQTAIDELEEEGVSVGLFRPITLFPFPEKELYAEATKQNIKKVLTIEMSMPQMCEDVVRSLYGKRQVEFFGRTGGIVPTPVDVKEQVHKLLGKGRPAARKTKKRKA